MLGEAGTFMGRVLAVGAVMGTIGAMTSLVTLLVTVVTDNRMGWWVQGWWASRVGLHGPMTVAIKAVGKVQENTREGAGLLEMTHDG